jgi:Zn-dependent peptidase ImmA (M78 family)
LFDRGFKTWCENYATSVRKEVGVGPSHPLDPWHLADHLDVRVWTPHQVPGLSESAKRTLLQNDGHAASCWSAVTMIVNGRTLVIVNSSHSKGRQASDLTHELAHRILKHATHELTVSSEGMMLLSAYDKKQEDEADWLSSCLLLPREALVNIAKRSIEKEIAAATYGVSVRMLNYRIAMTGVSRQFKYT